MLLLIADIRLEERVGDPGLHSVQGTFKVSVLDMQSFDVLLQGQEGSLSAYCRYLGQETDTEVGLSVCSAASSQQQHHVSQAHRPQPHRGRAQMCYGD